jgi:beta-lactamase superfamily II metal-dependent hydrolase
MTCAFCNAEVAVHRMDCGAGHTTWRCGGCATPAFCWCRAGMLAPIAPQSAGNGGSNINSLASAIFSSQTGGGSTGITPIVIKKRRIKPEPVADSGDSDNREDPDDQQQNALTTIKSNNNESPNIKRCKFAETVDKLWNDVQGGQIPSVNDIINIDDDDEEEEDEDDDLDLDVINFHFLDVGMGDSTLITCGLDNTDVILIDCGSVTNHGDNQQDSIEFIVQQLILNRDARNRVYKDIDPITACIIDRVYFTHPDRDHYNLFASIEALLNFRGYQLQVGAFYIGGRVDQYNIASVDVFGLGDLPTVKTILENSNNVRTYGAAFQGEEAERVNDFVDIQVLSANAVPLHSETRSNAASLCILVSTFTTEGGTKALFLGDAEQTVEEALLENHGDAILNCTVLKMGHHGSQRGTTPPFVARVNPQHAYASSGVKWTHPYSSAVDNVRAAPAMQRFGPNDPSHSLLQGNQGEYERLTTSQPVYGTLMNASVQPRHGNTVVSVRHDLNIKLDGSVTPDHSGNTGDVYTEIVDNRQTFAETEQEVLGLDAPISRSGPFGPVTKLPPPK